AVVASGGGTLNDPLNRWDLWSHGTAVWLRAPANVLAARVAADHAQRPLLGRDAAAGLARLAEERAPFYRAADLRTDADRPASVVADELMRLRRPARRRLFDAHVQRHHPIGPPHAQVVFGVDLELPVDDRSALIIDSRLTRLQPGLIVGLGAGRCLAISGGERSKRMRTLERVLEWLATSRAERGEAIVGVGGGTVGDLAGLAAALYARGVPYVAVPTTWLAQADAALGGKVGVDLAAAKNAVGAFWPPWSVYADVGMLRTLPRRRLRDGLAEAVKAALIGDADLWSLLHQRGRAALARDEAARYAITERAARVKLAIVERDPFEQGERRRLNLGHTLGHALEIESRYRLPHGAAVALGLRAVAGIAVQRGAEPDLAESLDALLADLGFALRHSFDSGAVHAALAGDKKRLRGRQRWLLPMGMGQVVEVDDVTEAELNAALGRIGT
ncbi:MAG: bifunctional shikimate kinase/3-dehydroquinate synthase, partial [Chloroflexota bacterium]|nr:bifunctional shikimate kinase/3-dehydroquinate synthase [Chloroflexota bacterium]